MPSAAEWEALRLSALVGLGAVAAVLPFAILAGHLLATRDFRGKALVETVLLLPLVLPPVVTGWALLVLLGRRGPLGPALEALGLSVPFTWRGCVVASAVMAFPLAYRACRTAFEAVDPRLAAQARTLGATPALFTMTSRWEACSRSRRMPSATETSLVTSIWIGTAFPPSRSRSAAVSST